MTPANFRHVFNALNKRRPWQPFTLELVSGSRIEVNHPEAVTCGTELIAVRSSSGHNSYLEYTSVVRFVSVTGVT
jgi:hypothetical protein